MLTNSRQQRLGFVDSLGCPPRVTQSQLRNGQPGLELGRPPLVAGFVSDRYPLGGKGTRFLPAAQIRKCRTSALDCLEKCEDVVVALESLDCLAGPVGT